MSQKNLPQCENAELEILRPADLNVFAPCVGQSCTFFSNCDVLRFSLHLWCSTALPHQDPGFNPGQSEFR